MAELSKLKSRILKLLKEDEEFRYAVAGLIGLGEILKRLEEHDRKFNEILARLDKHEEILVKHSEEIARLREDMIAGFKRHDEEIARLREDMIAGFKRHDELFERHWQEIVRLREDMDRNLKRLTRHLDALGARWGMLSEKAFREGLRRVIEEGLGLKVEDWIRRDEEGYVYGHPSDVDLDVAVKDGKVILVEVKSHVRRSDVLVFKRKAEFYEKVEGRKPDRLLMVTPYADDDALETAKTLQVEVYTGM